MTIPLSSYIASRIWCGYSNLIYTAVHLIIFEIMMNRPPMANSFPSGILPLDSVNQTGYEILPSCYAMKLLTPTFADPSKETKHLKSAKLMGIRNI